MDVLIALFALSVLTAMIIWMLGDVKDAIHEAEVDALWDEGCRCQRHFMVPGCAVHDPQERSV